MIDMEQLVSEFALRNESCRVSVLRLGFRVSEDTTLARYLSLPIVPTFAGFDPRLQLLHEDDGADAIVRAVLGEHPGVFNVAADGVVLLSQAIAIMGGRPAPILPPYGHWIARLGLRAMTRVDIQAYLADVIAFGSVMDCSRLEAEFDWKPAHTSRAVMDALARGKELEVIEAPSPPQEYELQVDLQLIFLGRRGGFDHLEFFASGEGVHDRARGVGRLPIELGLEPRAVHDRPERDHV